MTDHQHALRCMLILDCTGLKIPALLQIFQVGGYPRLTCGLTSNELAIISRTEKQQQRQLHTSVHTNRTAKWPSRVLTSTFIQFQQSVLTVTSGKHEVRIL